MNKLDGSDRNAAFLCIILRKTTTEDKLNEWCTQMTKIITVSDHLIDDDDDLL